MILREALGGYGSGEACMSSRSAEMEGPSKEKAFGKKWCSRGEG